MNFFNAGRIFSYHAVFRELKTVDEVSVTGQEADLPATLFIRPGDYNFCGHIFKVREEGLYRFINLGIQNEQRMVYEKDIDVLLSSLAWIVSHGTADKKVDVEELSNKAKTGKLFLDCGMIVSWAVSILRSHNIEARVVRAITAENWNYFDDGHVLMEVFHPQYGHLVLFDLDNNTRFWKNSKPLNLIELSEALKTGGLTVEFISGDSNLNPSDQFVEKYDSNFYHEAIYASTDQLTAWYKRMIQIPIVDADDGIFFFNTQKQAELESFGYKQIDQTEFMKRFYP